MASFHREEVNSPIEGGGGVRLEYLPEGSPDCPLIRLFDFTPAEVAALGMAVAELAAHRTNWVAVHRLPGIISVGRCELTLLRRDREQAVVRVGPTAFECRFTTDTWEQVAEQISPFAEGAEGYQWLAGAPGEVSLLLSATGLW